jgi:aspartokinase-like uncharacterized kinase
VSLTVVKVGGSFARSPRLADLAAALVEGGGPAVAVPGGGPFADCVRREQGRIGYDDHAAHKMALFAMAQFGTLLISRNPRLVPATGPEGIQRALADKRVPVWLPLSLLGGNPAIPETWEMTSDSLAAWLAGQLKARRLIFLKSSAPRAAALMELIAKGVLDPLVPRFLAGANIEAVLCGPRDLARLGAVLATGDAIGRPIVMA